MSEYINVLNYSRIESWFWNNFSSRLLKLCRIGKYLGVSFPFLLGIFMGDFE